MIAKKVAGRSDKTIDQYVRAVNRFISITGKQLVDVVPDDFRAYLAHRMIDDGIQGQTLVNERSYISAFYDWAVSSELINRNPIKLTDPIKIPKIPKKAFTEMECERIRSACKTPKERALIEILLSTACRVSELISIKTCEIDGNRILVCGKGNKYGQVYLNPKAVYAIETYISSRTDNNPYLFPGKKGISSNRAIEKILHRIGECAGVENVHPHRFRRTAATMALRHGMSIEMVSKMLRHEKLQTTMIYLDLDDRELQYQHQKYVG
jgi:site-specific recombinase XerD